MISPSLRPSLKSNSINFSKLDWHKDKGWRDSSKQGLNTNFSFAVSLVSRVLITRDGIPQDFQGRYSKFHYTAFLMVEYICVYPNMQNRQWYNLKL